MKKIVRYGIAVLTAVLACLLSGCGGEEEQRIGVDGYAYAGKTVETSEYNGAKKITVAGDYLYYQQGTRQVKRIALEEFFDSGSLSGGETVFTVEGVLSAAGGTEEVEELRAADNRKNASLLGDKYRVGIWDYAVDGEGNIYGILAVENGIFQGDMEEGGGDAGRTALGLLCKQYADGEMAYRTRLPDFRILLENPDWLALDNGGRAYVLTAQAIVAVDADGAVKGSLPVELAVDEYDKRGVSGRLLEGSHGAVYYVADDMGGSGTETYLLNEGEALRLTPVSFLSARYDLDLLEGMDGILQMTSEGLYRCDVAGNTMEEILKWGDSNLIAEDIRAVAQVAEDRYLVDIPALFEAGGKKVQGEEKRLLTRTPVEELPEREIIVVASRYPTQDLRRCAVEFNRASEKYHVSIADYGGDAYMRLDADLVSRDAPDILDFTGLDVSKYAEREMLEDLSPCLEGDGQIRREDYLGNLLEGYTIKGRLVCIPKKFNAWVFWWLPQDTGGQGSWGMEDFMALAEKYPDRRTFRRDPGLFGTEYLLGQFCAPYYLERFVDWEAGTCSFDSEAFCRLLSWAAAQDRKDGLAQEALLGENQIDFGHYEYWRIRYGKDTTVMHGYPLADGKEVYLAEAEDALGILAGSEHKDGAWEFLRYFLLDLGDGNALPTRKALLEETMRDAMEEEPNSTHTYYINRVPVEVPLLQEEHAALMMQTIESIDFTPRTGAENDIVNVVWEEAQYLLDGSRTAEEAAAVIQNRAELILQER